MDEKKLKEGCEAWGKTLFLYAKLSTTSFLDNKDELRSLGLEKEDTGRMLLEMLIAHLYNITRTLDSTRFLLEEDLMRIILDSMHKSFLNFFKQEIFKDVTEKEKNWKLYALLDLLEQRYKEYDKANEKADEGVLKDDLFREVFKNLTKGKIPKPSTLIYLMVLMTEDRKNIPKITEKFKEGLWKEAQ